MNDESDIVTAIDRNTESIDRNTQAIMDFKSSVGNVGMWLFLLLWLGICVVGCPRATSAPLLTAAPEPPALQHWHTTYVPTDSGVYPMEVFAPALPPLFAQPQIVEIGTPPKPPVHVPEPGTWALVGAVLIPIALWQIALWDQRRENRKWGSVCTRANELANRYARRFNKMQYALMRVEESLDLNEAKEIARKALEEK